MATQEEAENAIADMLFGEEAEESQEEEQEVEETAESEEGESEEDQSEEDDSGEDKSKDEPEEPEYVEMDIDGNLYEIPVALKDHILRQQDYTQKTQEVSAQRKQIEAEQAQIAQERARYEFINSVEDEVNQVRQIEAAIPQWQQYLRENIDSLSATEIEKIRLNVDELKQQKDATQKALQQKYSEFQQAQEQSTKELLDKSTEVLKQKFPDWNQEKVQEYAKSLGFTEDQVRVASTDPKQMELVRKAMLYDQLQEGKTAAVAKAKAAPQIKPKSRNPMPKDVQDKLNLNKKLKNKKLSNSDKARLIGEDIAGRFF